MPSFLHIQFQVAETQHKLAYTKRKSLAPITKKFRFFNFSHSLIQEVKYHQDSLLPQICLLPVSSILSHVFHWLAQMTWLRMLALLDLFACCEIITETRSILEWVLPGSHAHPWRWGEFSSTWITWTERGEKACSKTGELTGLIPPPKVLCWSQKCIMDAGHEEREREGRKKGELEGERSNYLY